MPADSITPERRLLVGLAASVLLGFGAGQVRMQAFDVCRCIQCSCVQLCCDTSNCGSTGGTCDMDPDGCGYQCSNGNDDYFACSDYCS